MLNFDVQTTFSFCGNAALGMAVRRSVDFTGP
jgi:hypothetical protein